MTTDNLASTDPDSPTLMCAQASQLRHLQYIAEKWKSKGLEPTEAGPLSGGEYRAVCLAARQAAALRDPVGDFLVLDGWLQRWVLEQLGMSGFVGQRVGIDEGV